MIKIGETAHVKVNLRISAHLFGDDFTDRVKSPFEIHAYLENELTNIFRVVFSKNITVICSLERG